MADPLYGRLQPLPSRGGFDAHLVDDGAGALHRRAFADEVEPARNIGIHIGAGTEAFDVGAMRPETDIGDGIEIAREIWSDRATHRSCLGRLGKPFIHFFLVGEQLLDARALLHGPEMRRDVGEARDVHLQLGGTAAAHRATRRRYLGPDGDGALCRNRYSTARRLDCRLG